MQNSPCFGRNYASFLQANMSKWSMVFAVSKLILDFESLRSKSTKESISYDLMTFCYEVMTKSISDKGHLRFENMLALISTSLVTLKNEFSIFWPTSVPNFMFVCKSAQYSP